MSETARKHGRLKDLAVSTRDSFLIDPRVIRVEPGHNPRSFEHEGADEGFEELVQSIIENGVLNPMWVRYEGSQQQAILVDGERRLRGTLEAIRRGHDIKAVPAIQVRAGNEADRLALALLANAHRKTLHPWEDGISYRKLENFGWTVEQMAKKFTVTERYIRDAMELADSPVAVKKMLNEGTVTPAKALAVVRKQGDNASKVLAGEVKEARGQGKEKVTRSLPTRISQEDAKNFAEVLRTIIRERGVNATTLAKNALEGAGLTW